MEKIFEIEWKIDEMFTWNLKIQFSQNPIKNRRAFKETKQVNYLKGKINLFSREWCFQFSEPQSVSKRWLWICFEMKWSHSNQAIMNVMNIDLDDWFLEGISKSYRTFFWVASFSFPIRKKENFIKLGFKLFKL